MIEEIMQGYIGFYRDDPLSAITTTLSYVVLGVGIVSTGMLSRSLYKNPPKSLEQEID